METANLSDQQVEYFAACPKNMEALLGDELNALGMSNVRQTKAGVYFRASLAEVYRVVLWTRLANRILLPLVKGPVDTAEQLYEFVYQQPWEEHFSAEKTFVVDFSGSSGSIRHTQFGAQKVKDAIVDRFAHQLNTRPSVDKNAADIRVNARLARGKLALAFDLSGESLHRRGYRRRHGAAPLKENLAAAILWRADWPKLVANARAEQRPLALMDPMCGSGTLLIEGAMMAASKAPGILRRNFALEHLNGFDRDVWRQEWEIAQGAAVDLGQEGLLHFYGYDIDREVLEAATRNAGESGLADCLNFARSSVAELAASAPAWQGKEGVLVCNPPYGERLGEQDALRDTYRELGQMAKTHCQGWKLALITANPELAREARLRVNKRYKFYNGALETELLLYDIVGGESKLREDETEEAWRTRDPEPQVAMVMNRLKKNLRRLQPWLKREDIACYRLYDADMPEYAAAVDVYGAYFHVQEYQAPKTIDPRDTRRRHRELREAIARVFDCDPDHIVSKLRRRHRGKSQYQKLDRDGEQNAHFIEVSEGRATLAVNLRDYLDSGLFLDHRPLRMKLFQVARGRKFLNLFCYTASATVHAALGGAIESTSVDMSKTYLAWAARNFALNNVSRKRHHLVREDVIAWLKNCREGYDLIMLDPPTFSNSKRTDTILDIQRDHGMLVRRCMELLRPGGILFFSCNLRSFRLDESLLSEFQVADISTETIGPDFERNPKIHRCWEFRAH